MFRSSFFYYSDMHGDHCAVQPGEGTSSAAGSSTGRPTNERRASGGTERGRGQSGYGKRAKRVADALSDATHVVTL